MKTVRKMKKTVKKLILKKSLKKLNKCIKTNCYSVNKKINEANQKKLNKKCDEDNVKKYMACKVRYMKDHADFYKKNGENVDCADEKCFNEYNVFYTKFNSLKK